jgi:integrase
VARGSVYKRSGGWAFRVDVGFHPDSGKRRQIRRQGFPTKKQAEAALEELLRSAANNTIVARSSVRLGEYLETWLAGQPARVRETTLRGYGIAVQRIVSRLGQVPLQALTPLQIERFYAELLADGGRRAQGLAPKTVRNTHVVLRKALADAERLGLVPRNAAAAAHAPAARRTEFETWSADELLEFLLSVRDDRLFAAFLLLATTGMRRGEVLGLRWRDVDIDASRLSVVQTLAAVGWETRITQPKTQRSRRTIYLDAETVIALKEHRRRQREEQLAAGEAWNRANDLLFRDELGRPLHPEWFSREFNSLVASSGLPRIRLHDLRHTCATLALEAGVHPKVVSERLGHATIGVTLDLYSHVTPGIARDAAETIAARILPARVRASARWRSGGIALSDIEVAEKAIDHDSGDDDAPSEPQGRE